MKIHVLTCFYGRQHITEIFLEGIKRLQKEFDLSYTFVASELSDVNFNVERGFTTHKYHNQPLSNKWNYGLNIALKSKWDYLLIMGSDDLISNDGIKLLLNNSYNYKGFKDIVFYNTLEKKSAYFKYDNNSRLIGCGRMISREAIETILYRTYVHFRKNQVIGNKKVMMHQQFTTTPECAKYLDKIGYGKQQGRVEEGVLWKGDLDSGLDHSSELNLVYHGFYPHVVGDDRVHMIDIKSHTNITQWVNLLKTARELEFDFWFLSDREKDLLFSL